MKTFLLSGGIYLTGIAIILLVKPSLMFTPDGIWKEFGIGRNPATHTWMPLWLFTILWALLSYLIAQLILVTLSGNSGKKSSLMEFDIPEEEILLKKSIKRGKLPSGYYLLNSQTPTTGGIPNYIYLGKDLPMDTE